MGSQLGHCSLVVAMFALCLLVAMCPTGLLFVSKMVLRHSSLCSVAPTSIILLVLCLIIQYDLYSYHYTFTFLIFTNETFSSQSLLCFQMKKFLEGIPVFFTFQIIDNWFEK